MQEFPPGMLRPEAERYFGVLLERLEHKFDQFLEYVPVMDEKVQGLEVRMDQLEIYMENMTLTMIVLEKSISELKGEIVAMREELKQHLRVREFTVLERRVSAIEQALVVEK